MEFVSSDTNVWIDFQVIDRLQLPFLLPYTYIMYTESIDSELISPSGFREDLLKAGLKGVDITIEEFLLADFWGILYPKLSIQDRIALAIAKHRDIVLLTGDMALRKAATKEGVSFMGTLGVLDRLHEGSYITSDEYEYCLSEFSKRNGGQVRLPSDELKKRIERLKTSKKIAIESECK